MKTYPLLRDDGELHGFEIGNTWISIGAILRLIRSVPGVSEVRRVWFREEHVKFLYQGAPFEVWEPFGDNSRYWIGPEVPGPDTPNMTAIHSAFVEYQNPFSNLLSRVQAVRGSRPPQPPARA